MVAHANTLADNEILVLRSARTDSPVRHSYGLAPTVVKTGNPQQPHIGERHILTNPGRDQPSALHAIP